MKFIALIFFLLFVIICTGQSLVKIDVESILDREDFSVNNVDFIDEISYIPLETTVDCLIDENAKFTLTEKYILVRDQTNCFLFDRNTGRFVKKIGQKGKGPGEYRTANGFFDPITQTIYLKGWSGGQLLRFSMDNGFIGIVTIPGTINSFDSPSLPTNFTYLNKLIVSYYGNMVGIEKKLLCISDLSGGIIKLFPNRNSVERKNNISISNNESQFYHFNQELYFKEDYSDTIYKVTTNRLIPHLIIHLGKYQPFYESKWYTQQELKKLGNDLIGLRHLIESDNYMFFEMYFHKRYYQAVYNKKSLDLKIEEKQVIRKIDNECNAFYPVSNVMDKYVLGFIESYKFVDWLNQNPKQKNNLPLKFQKLKHVNETDNPIIMMVKLKE